MVASVPWQMAGSYDRLHVSRNVELIIQARSLGGSVGSKELPSQTLLVFLCMKCAFNFMQVSHKSMQYSSLVIYETLTFHTQKYFH